MQHYRLYIVTAAEDISRTVEDDYPNDLAALAQAARLQTEEHAVEVWTGERLVARLGGAFDFGRRA
ncbi:MAG: hypothetical protein Q7S93_08230 [Phenylobacterium sp.]|uniref:hypothetical protein n=1 Tax=Phenylobacterium sp. TaxID=1871053 RepID=UPI0027290F50|nr:hypothetical protein [Phenylobacterium sp.]MDO8410034.1 hypothetical protein [Phenylobacterium sp.]